MAYSFLAHNTSARGSVSGKLIERVHVSRAAAGDGVMIKFEPENKRVSGVFVRMCDDDALSLIAALSVQLGGSSPTRPEEPR